MYPYTPLSLSNYFLLLFLIALLIHGTDMWSRPPNFLLVDFYNEGPVPGSVFQVAARANNVTYNRECCGKGKSAAVMLFRPSPIYIAFVTLVSVALVL